MNYGQVVMVVHIYMFACVKVSFRKKNLKGYADTYIFMVKD